VVPTTVSTHCDAASQISGTVTSNGKVTFSPTGVTLLVGGGYSDSAGGSCPVGGTCEIVVTDSDNPAIALSIPVTFATPTTTLKRTAAVPANYVDKVIARAFPVGDSVIAGECDSSVNPATNLATNCDTATVINGIAGSNGTVNFSSTGVTVKVGSAYIESGTGTCLAGGTCSIVATDATHAGISVVIPITLAP